ncbi:MAG: hypothetical protein LBK83_11730 [Treponema sp.]|jgi:hypothetical protein|nr:hypothetical protein [Treponema sp.]
MNGTAGKAIVTEAASTEPGQGRGNRQDWDGRYMGKKILLFILIIFLSVSGFSLELNIVNKYNSAGLIGAYFSYLFYFRERFFCLSTSDILYATENRFERVIEKKITDEILRQEYYQVARIYVSDDSRRLYYIILGIYGTRYYTGFEITVDNNGNISYRKRNKDEIDANTVNEKRPYFVGLSRDNPLLNGYWLKTQEREEGNKSPPHINIVDRKGNNAYIDIEGE